MWGIASRRNISDSGAAFLADFIRFQRPVITPYNRMSPKKLTTFAFVAAAAAIACYGAYDASAKTTAGANAHIVRADTDTVVRKSEPAPLHPTPPVLDSL